MKETALAIAGISLILSSISGCSCKGAACHELANKPIYADLQALEFEHRGQTLSDPLYLKRALDIGKFDALGIPAKSGRLPNVWIAVNTNDGAGGILAVPSDEDVKVGCDFVGKLAAENKDIDAVVEDYLKRQCTK